METRAKEPKLTPRKGKAKFSFLSPTEAPVFEPTLEEFENPLEYIKKIRVIGEKSGVCKIIPPKGWKPPFALDKSQLKFTPRIQRINELEARTRIKLNFIDQLTKFFALRGKTFQIPLVEKTSLDLYTLHRLVKEKGGIDGVNKGKKWSDISNEMGFVAKTACYTLKHHYDDLILPFLQTQKSDENRESMTCSRNNGDKNLPNHPTVKPTEEAKDVIQCIPTLRELKSLKFLGPGPKMAVCEEDDLLKENSRTRGKKIMYEFDPLAKYMCKSCCTGDIEEPLVICVTCEDKYHSSCLIPRLIDIPDNWRCPKCVAAEVYKPLEEFGFAQAEREYTLNEFQTMADQFKRTYFNVEPTSVPTSKVEQEFWRVVSSIDEAVTVEYGADLHVIDHGSAFPRFGKEHVEGIDEEEFSKYASSPWNLNNLPVLNSSVLRHISADISGMKIPWMYAGMCFAAFCWHNEDHWSYSINYLHLGEPKTWYGVSGHHAEKFEKAMKNAAPELFAAQPDLLHHLVTIMNPNDLMNAGVQVCRTDQKEGEFVITFPRAYHAGFNQGFNFAEACNFAPYDWLQMGRECISHYSSLKRPCVFSHDELVCNMALIVEQLDKDIAEAIMKDMIAMVNAETIKWNRAVSFGINTVVDFNFETVPDDERVCAECNTTVFLSSVFCPCNRTKLVCLEHIHKLCECKPSNYIVKCQFRINFLREVVEILKTKLFKFGDWKKKVERALSPNGVDKISLRALTELLIEAKEKDFPQSDLIDLLEFQVRKCIDCSALARVIVGNGLVKKANIQNKLTIDDIAMFYDEIVNLPCTIMEAGELKKLLNEALKFQKVASMILSRQAAPRARIANCLKLGKSLDLDLMELPLLERRLEEFDWVQNADELLSDKSAKVQEVEDLLASCPSSSNIKVNSKKDELAKYLEQLKEMIETSTSFLTTPNVELESNQLSLLSANEKTHLSSFEIKLEPNLSITEETINKVLIGEEIKYLFDLESLLAKAKLEYLDPNLIFQLEEAIQNINRWMSFGKRIFLKRNSNITLMQALWPRRFESRATHYQRSLLQHSRNIESLIDENDYNFTKTYFDYCFEQQFQTLKQLRVENLEATAQMHCSVAKRCVCGETFKFYSISCVLCKTSFHVNCFKIDENILNSKIVCVSTKNICSYCAVTKRPSIESVKTFFNTADLLKVKVPECIALEFIFEKFLDWQKEAKTLLESKTMSDNLKLITNNMADTTESWNQFKAQLTRRKNTHPFPSPEMVSEIKFNMEDSTALRHAVFIGDMFEITCPEIEQLWLLYDIWQIKIQQLTPKMINNNNSEDSVSSSSSPKRKSIKSAVKKKKQCNKNFNKMDMGKKPKENTTLEAVNDTPPETSDSRPKFIKKRRRKSGPKLNHVKKSLTPHPFVENAPQLQMGVIWEEHEEGDPCAAANCQKPNDFNVSWVQCDGQCGQWFHMKCVDLENDHLGEDEEFICAHCNAPSKEDICPPFKKIKLPLTIPEIDIAYFLCQFINKLEHPEVDLHNYINNTLTVSEQLSKLSDGISLLDKELQRQVLEKHEDLVSQATWVEKLQEVLSIMHIHVQSLVSSVERVKVKIVEPYHRLETQSIVLSRLHETTDLLRRASRIQHLTKKLHDLDAPRAAHVLAELEELHRDVDLSGLEILEPEEKQIKHVKATVEQQANKIVEQGLATLNPDKVAVGIEIMDKLGLSEIEVQKMMDKWLNHIDTCVRNALNMENLTPTSTRGGAGRVSGISIPANIQNFRSELWTAWENTLNKPVYTMCAQMAVIQTVLNNRLTYNNGKMSGNDEKSEAAYVFWCQVDDILTKQLNQAAKNSSYMKQALEGEYPKLLRLHLDLHKKLKALNAAESSSKPMFPPIGKCVKQFETAYLTRSVNVLTGAVQEMFSQNETSPQPPSREKVDALVKTISRELDVSLVDEALTGPVAKNVAKAISLFCQKGEQMLVNTPAATQVIESQTVGQELNVGIANIVFYLCDQLKTTVNKPGLSKNIASHINKAIAEGDRLTQQILNPLLASILVAIESILLTMHKEDYELKEYSGSTSLYMRELQAFIARAVTSYLTPFHNQLQVSHSCMDVASRTIELFLRHTSLVRPLNDKGRKKLIADFKCLEDALSPLCMQLSELGAIYSTLRSLRPLITAKPDDVALSPVLGQVIPYSLAITLLFSMGPPELPSPHQSVGWSIAKLSEWLDSHTSEQDRLELLSGALRAYKQTNPKATNNPLYDTIKNLIDRGNAYLLTDPNAL